MIRTVFFALVSLAMSAAAFAQNAPRLKVPTLSPITEIAQEVALSEVKLSYSRPAARGRKVFGELVPFGEVWRTGANASTKITFAEDVKVAGNDLKAGTYAIYTIPGEKEWTIIVHTNTGLRSLAGDAYKPENDAFRFMAKPEKLTEYVESFTIAFTDISSDAVNIALSWENTSVKFPVVFDVESNVEKQIADLGASTEGLAAFDYFLAAEYYLHNDKDLKKAESWIKSGLEKSPKNFRFGLLHAKILAKQGNKDAALKTIAEANAWATEAKNANYIEQTRLFWESIK